MSVKDYWSKINKESEKVSSLMNSYWHEHSDWNNWQFWIILSLLILPLIILLIKVDKEKTLRILFFGYTVHMLWTYTETVLIRMGYMDHHYFLLPFLPQAIGLTSSFLPVSFMFVYQYCIKHEKNFLLWTAVLSAIMAFIFVPIEKQIGFLVMLKGLNNFHIFLIDIIITMIAYGLTKFFITYYEKGKN
ncbi:hypothetical protein [Niallia sp.]|uniref:hypothetical protein n=1 Tax=Niallia sp. TaxID=2837523 RepID=UPI0028A16D1D|nr:hypothetical protein [Niallia sp.]